MRIRFSEIEAHTNLKQKHVGERSKVNHVDSVAGVAISLPNNPMTLRLGWEERVENHMRVQRTSFLRKT